MAGWNTTDEDEIAVRKKRALKEEFKIINLKRKNRVFSSYMLKSKNNSYLVELRFLKENINSCSCPDIAVNKLGTCKHIEAVKLLHKDKKPINKNIEIYLDTKDEKLESKINTTQTEDKNIQILDKQQYKFLQDLASSGLISLNSDLENLYNSKQIEPKKIDAKLLVSIKEKFNNIKRKYKMAKLLLKGGFLNESKPIVIEVSKMILDLKNILNENSISLTFDQDFIQYINNIEKINKIKRKYFIVNMKQLFSQIKKMIKELSV